MALQNEYCRSNHNQLFMAIRNKDDFSNCKVFSILSGKNIDFGGGQDPDYDLELFLFGGDGRNHGSDGQDGNLHVEIPLETMIISDKLKGQLGKDLLHEAAGCGNHFIVKCLIRLGVPVNVLNDAAYTPLMTALQKRAGKRTISTLLDFKANIYYETPNGISVLLVLANSSLKQWESIKLVLKVVKRVCFYKSDITAKKLLDSNCTICHAVLLKDLEILRIMLNNGCSIHTVDPKTRKTALHVAILVKNFNTVKFLVENGADINAVDVERQSPFTSAYRYDKSFEESEILNYLLDQGSSLDLPCLNYYNQQMYILSNGKKQIVRTLLSRHCVDINVRDLNGRTSLHYIAQNDRLVKDKKLIEYLQQRRIDVNVLDNDKCSPLHLSAQFQNFSLTKYLLQNGAKVNVLNHLDATPLYEVLLNRKGWTERRNIYNVIKLLLLYGADPQLSSLNGVIVDDDMLDNYNNLYKADTDNDKKTPYNFVNPIMAYLVLHVAKGGKMTEFTRRTINSGEQLKNELKSCQEDLEKLKNIKLHESLTAYNLMLNSEREIMLSARNGEMYTLMMNFYNTFSSDSYYVCLLKERLEKIFLEIKLRQRAVDILCKSFATNYSQFPEIIDKIIDYSDQQDLQIVFHV